MTRSGADVRASSGTGRRRVRPPVKAVPVRIDPAMTPEVAVRMIAAATFRHLRGNERGAMVGADPEHVHQMRVATRRMRCVLRLFAGTSAALIRTRHDAGLKTLGAALGAVRDLDVLSDLLRPPFPQELDVDRLVLANTLDSRSALAQARLHAYLESPDYARLVDCFEEWLRAESAEDLAEDLPTLARHRLRNFHRCLLRGAEHYRSLGERARHRFRVDVKRARYGVEFFGSLYPSGLVSPYFEALSELQDSLGCLTDINMARRLLRDVGMGRDSREVMVRHWLRGAEPADAGLARAFRRIRRTGGFWKRQH